MDMKMCQCGSLMSQVNDKEIWMCSLCDLWPHNTEVLGKTERMNIAKAASEELDRRRRRDGR